VVVVMAGMEDCQEAVRKPMSVIVDSMDSSFASSLAGPAAR